MRLFSYKILWGIITGITIILLFYFISPTNIPSEGIYFTVNSGSSTYAVAKTLESSEVIRSPFAFRVFVKLLRGDKSLNAGEYFIDKPINVIQLAQRMINGEHGITAVKVTFPEGTSVKEMSAILSKQLDSFDSKEFLRLAGPKEGYLFPDTYFFMPTATSGEIITKMEQTFENKIESINQNINSFKRPLKDIITMASIIEKEANDEKSRRLVSGILWKRIDNMIALQVDAPFVYLINKGSSELTKTDLQIDSPYNTYKYRGLPKGPITNPGIDAILAAVSPQKSEYLYFLTDIDGKMHYAKTFDEHLELQRKYIK